MSTKRAEEQRILRQAAEWFATLHDEAPSEAEHQRWRAWLAASPAHARVWERVTAISQPFARATGAVPPQAVRETLARTQSAGRRRALGLLGLGGVLIGSGLLLRHILPWQSWQQAYALAHADHRTRIGERQQVALPDGTRLDLNTATAANVDYGPSLRRIVLLAGEILVESAPDQRSPGRALVVETAGARLTALGTRFAVRGDTHGGHLAVFEGAVRIELANGAQRKVAAGQQARFTADAIAPDGLAELARESWARGQLVADDISLAALVGELSRYTPVAVTVSPEAAHLRIVGAYPIAQPARDIPVILAALESALPIHVERTPDAGLHIRMR